MVRLAVPVPVERCISPSQRVVSYCSVTFDAEGFTAAMKAANCSIRNSVNRASTARMVSWLLRQPELQATAAAAAADDLDE